MSDEPWDKQKREKYRDHDFLVEELKSWEIESIRGQAIRGFIETRDSDNISLVIKSFMGYLTSKGYRIVKKEIG